MTEISPRRRISSLTAPVETLKQFTLVSFFCHSAFLLKFGLPLCPPLSVSKPCGLTQQRVASESLLTTALISSSDDFLPRQTTGIHRNIIKGTEYPLFVGPALRRELFQRCYLFRHQKETEQPAFYSICH